LTDDLLCCSLEDGILGKNIDPPTPPVPIYSIPLLRLPFPSFLTACREGENCSEDIFFAAMSDDEPGINIF
jgi:hypothetical protein